MAIPLLVSTSTSLELVWTGDPCVDADGPDRWILAADVVCKRGADLVAIRALNGEERWLAQRRDADEDHPSHYYWCDMGVVSLNGDATGLRDWIRSLPPAVVILLATAIMSVTYGVDIAQHQPAPAADPEDTDTAAAGGADAAPFRAAG